MNAQEEIKARLEVAQLYDEMGQKPKAARYYLNGAEIALKAKLFDQGKTLLEKVLELDPDNKEARSYLDRLNQHLAAHGGGAVAPSRAANVPKAQGLTVPTPSVYLRKDQITAILAQVASAPNAKFFPFDPLPQVDLKAIEKKAKLEEAKREEQRAKERTTVDSAFSSGPSPFARGGKPSGFLEAQRGGGRSREREKSVENAPEERNRRGGGRSGNVDLAESIRRRLQGG